MLPREFDNTAPLIKNNVGTWAVNPLAKNSQRLMSNQLYTLQVRIKDEMIQGTFTSALEPLFSTVQVIRSDIGEVIADQTDAQINFKIYQSSLLAQQLAAASQKFQLQGSGLGNTQLQFSGVTKDEMWNALPHPTPYYVQQYVRYKTEMDLVYAKYILLSSQAGMVEKDLADFKIIRQVLIPKVAEMLAEIKTNLREWEDMIRGGGSAKPKRTTRAKGSAYPIGSRMGKMTT